MNRKAFYDAVRPTLGALTQGNVVGFELMLDESQRRATRLHDLAYILATSWGESGRSMQPVREAFWLSEAWRQESALFPGLRPRPRPTHMGGELSKGE